MISATVAGNVGKTPELRHAGQTPVVNISVASNGRQKRDGQWQDVTTWVGVVVFGKRAEGLANVVEKGSYVVARGALQVREYTTRDGEKRTALEVVADDVVLGPRRNGPRAADSQPSLPGEDFGDDTPPF